MRHRASITDVNATGGSPRGRARVGTRHGASQRVPDGGSAHRALHHAPFALLFAASNACSSVARTQTIAVTVILQIEVLGRVAQYNWLPKVVTRKLTHIVCGCSVAIMLPLFPRHFWPARLAATLFFSLYIPAFSAIAYAPEDKLHRLPPVLQRRISAMGERGDLPLSCKVCHSPRPRS